MSYELVLTDASFRIDRARLERYLAEEERSLEAFLDDECWAFRLDGDGNVVDVDLKVEHATGELDGWLDSLAGIVRKGSYLELRGDDGATGRIDFDGKRRILSGPLFEDDDDEDDDEEE
jgi:hypothetical protein